MSNLISLIYVELKQNFRTNSKRKNFSFKVTLISLMVLMLALGSFYSYFMASAVRQINEDYRNIVIIMQAFATFMIFVQLIIATKKIFIGKDYDMLESMPIKKSTIVLAKFINLYLVGLFFSFGLLLPANIVCGIFSKDYWYYIKAIFDVLLVPVFPLLLSALLSTIFSFISAKSKKFSNIIDFIFNLLTILGIFAISFGISMSSQNTGPNKNPIDLSFAKNLMYVNPIFYFSNESFNNKLYLLLFIFINVILLILVAYFVAFFYRRIHLMLNSSRSNTKYVRKDLHITSEFKTFLSFELKKILNTKMYLIQILVGGIISIIVTTVICVILNNTKKDLSPEVLPDFVKIMSNLNIVSVVFISYFLGIYVPTQALVNLEGKSIYILKSMPINVKQWLRVKLFIGLCVSIIFSIISSTIVVILLREYVNAWQILFTYIAPILFIAFENILLLYTNLKNPKFDWLDEQQLVKQSQNMLSVFLDLAFTILNALIIVGGFFLSIFKLNLDNVYIPMAVFIIVYLTLDIVLYKVLMNNCQKYYEKI